MTDSHEVIKEPPNLKRRELSRYKCEECRRNKKKCLPENRVWPEVCSYCSRKGLPCSRPQPPQSSVSKRTRMNSQTPSSIATVDRITSNELGHEEATFLIEKKDNAVWHAPSTPCLEDKSSGRHALQEDRHKILISSLAHTGMGARLHNVSTAYPETCNWILQHPKFEAWTDADKQGEHNGILWIKGKPGAGKSTLMKFVSDWARRTWNDWTVIVHFFNFRAPEKLERSSQGLLQSVTYQLLLTNEIARSTFLSEFSLKLGTHGVHDWTETELRNFLVQLVTTKCLHHTVLFVDALDECCESDIREVLYFFEDITDRSISTGSSFHVCLSSRHYPHVTLKKGLFIIMEEELGHLQAIDEYVTGRFAGSQHFKQSLQRELVDRSAGIFLWVVLAVQQLNYDYDSGYYLDIARDRLKTIPQSLGDMFGSILAVEDTDAKESLTLFQWVLASQRPLGVLELYFGVKTTLGSPEDSEFAITEFEYMRRYVLKCSRGLVEITQDPESRVQFIHETVPEYLSTQWTSASMNTFQSWGGSSNFQPDVCHGIVAEGCLEYLLKSHSVICCGRHLFEQRPLVRYAAEYWWQHMKLSDGKHSLPTQKLALELLNHRATGLLTWLRLYNIEHPSSSPDFSLKLEDLCSSIYYAALIGSPELVRLVLPQTDVNASEGRYGSALQAASAYGHLQVVQILLAHGANVNALGGQYGCALQAASVHGDVDIVQVLINHGADVDALGGQYGTALDAAIRFHHKDVTKLLLNMKADVNAQRKGHGIALLTASRSRYTDTIELLLRARADVNAQGGRYGNALQIAALEGHKDVVRLLLEAGADVNALGGQYGCALQAASAHGNTRVVEILLEAGADINALGGQYGCALQAASAHGNTRVVEILLEAGADVNAQGGQYGCAIQAVAWEGTEKIVELLLEAGAAVNTPGGFFGQALQASCAAGHETITRRLLESGADVNARGGQFSCALHAASRNGHARIIRLLIDQGLDIEVQDEHGSALQVASVNGHEEVVKVLVDAGAHVNSQSPRYGSAVLAASTYGHKRIVEILIAAGANTNTSGG